MSDLWLFLSDPNNQKTLAWIGGGIVVAAGGLWTVVQFFARRERPDAPSSPAGTRIKVTATHGGMAAGRDQHIGVAPPSKGRRPAKRRAR
jgi:hypothetical protein